MIYVDELRTAVRFKPGTRRWGTEWCHMTADNEDELHAFAARLGLKRSWYQKDRPYAWHYDLIPSKRALAVSLGAKEVTARWLCIMMWNRPEHKGAERIPNDEIPN